MQSTGSANPPGRRVRVGRVWVRVTIHSPLHKPVPVNGLTGVNSFELPNHIFEIRGWEVQTLGWGFGGWSLENGVGVGGSW